jgi:hypothetical protein
MQEAPEPFVRTEKPAGLAFYLAMLASSAIGLVLSVFLAHAALTEINNSEIRFIVPTDFILKGTVSSKADFPVPQGLPRYSDTEIDRYVKASMEPKIDSGWEVRFQKPNRPWLCVALVFLLSNVLLYLHRIYLILLRSKAAENMTALHSKVMAMAGLLYFAGNENLMGVAILGIVMMAYAGIGYLAYTRWERVRAQLYRD